MGFHPALLSGSAAGSVGGWRLPAEPFSGACPQQKEAVSAKVPTLPGISLDPMIIVCWRHKDPLPLLGAFLQGLPDTWVSWGLRPLLHWHWSLRPPSADLPPLPPPVCSCLGHFPALCISISMYSCHRKYGKGGGLQQEKFIPSPFWRVPCSLLRALGDTLFQVLFLAAGVASNPWRSLLLCHPHLRCHCHVALSLSAPKLPSSSEDTGRLKFRTYSHSVWSHLNQLQLWRSSFQKRSHASVWGLSLQLISLGGKI